jgi:hypothetical protein
MAADLVQQSSTAHTFIHDLESAFWVMHWVVLLYLKTTWNDANRSSFLKEMMSPRVYKSSGGKNKLFFMQSEHSLSGFSVSQNPALTALLLNLKKTLSIRHWPDPSKASEPSTLDPLAVRAQIEGLPTLTAVTEAMQKEALINKYKGLMACLKSHKVILGMIAMALNLKSWPKADTADPQLLVTSNEVEATMQSSSKRSRSAAEGNGVFVLPPSAKRSDIA